MLTILENAVSAYVAAKFAANGSLDGELYAVRESTSPEPLPGDRAVVLVKVSDAPSPIPGILYDGMCEISAGVLYDVEAAKQNDAQALILKLEKAITRAFDRIANPTATADYNAAVVAADSDWKGGDFSVEGWQPARDESELKPYFSVKCGMSRV